MIVKNKIASRMIKQLLNLVFAKYRDYQSRADQLFADAVIIDLRDTDKSRYFAQPRPIIAHYVKVKIIVYSNHGKILFALSWTRLLNNTVCNFYGSLFYLFLPVFF